MNSLIVIMFSHFSSRSGGDFHSRTAMGMYPEIAEAVAKGKVLLEWDKSKGKPPAPLLKV
jgi:DNA polymerase-1